MPGEYVVRWTGGRIGLGASVFHMQGTESPSAALAAATAVRNFFDTLKSQFPPTVSMTFDPEFKNLTAAGVLTSVVPIAAPVQVIGTGAGTFANGTGAMIRWNTSAVVAGRRLLGRTYLVPLVSGAFVSGNVASGNQSTIANAGTALISALASNGTPLQVWSKANAVTGDVITAQVPSRPSSLRTRNDRD